MRFYKIGSWLLCLTGIGDIICTDLFRKVFLKIENQAVLFNTMENTDVNFLGLHRNMLSFFNGFSLSTGVLLTFVGVFNLLIIRSNMEMKSLRVILITNFILLVYFIFVCSVFLPVHGVVIASIVLLLFIVSFFQIK
jgi:hypothetical protein